MYMGSSGTTIGLIAVHLLWTVSSIQFAMVVPTLGFAGIFLFALAAHRAEAAAYPAKASALARTA
jgi:hypothetical protein